MQTLPYLASKSKPSLASKGELDWGRVWIICSLLYSSPSEDMDRSCLFDLKLTCLKTCVGMDFLASTGE
jgi:hypothetical protein